MRFDCIVAKSDNSNVNSITEIYELFLINSKQILKFWLTKILFLLIFSKSCKFG